MDHAARAVMDAYPDIVLGFGESDEYRQVNISIYLLSLSISHKCPADLLLQLSPPQIDSTVQSPACQNSYHTHVLLHLLLRLPLERLLPRSTVEVSAEL